MTPLFNTAFHLQKCKFVVFFYAFWLLVAQKL